MNPTNVQTCRMTAILLLISLGYCSSLVAEEPVEHFESDVQTTTKPWTHLNFDNDPQNFKFAIVSDRAGGVRPGVLADAVGKLNLILPEFVMSVGDFIPGNTADRAQLQKEWAEFDAELKDLKSPFFFVPGNHDINNGVQREVWKERSGVPFYSFVYKNVLFLALDTTGEKGDIVPDYQVEAMRQALEKHPDARWTFVFMHHPLWLYDNPAGFAQVEELLVGRKYTVIAGHFHRYLQEVRNNSNYYVLATTGGGSQLRGPRYGEFDHVTLVTVTDDGPVIANLRLDGILPHNATTRADYEASEALMTGADLPYLLLTDDEQNVSAGALYLTLRNPAEQPLQVKARFMHDHEVQMNPSEIDVIVPAKSEKEVVVAVKATRPVPTDKPVLLQLHWQMGFDLTDKEGLSLSGTKDVALRPSSVDLIRTVAPEFEQPLLVAAAKPPQGFTLRYTTDGSTPTTSSAVYDKPLPVDAATTIKARLFNPQGLGTATSQRSYRPVAEGTGLRYRIYQGTWTRIPNFRDLTPVFEGVATDLNVESRQLRADNWGMTLEGSFPVEADGEYTFYLNSDDGSKLFVDDELVVDNDGDHSLLELKGAKQLTAGNHQIRIEFFEAAAEAILELDIEGPGLKRRSFPMDKASH
ncbi:PA14 domain-containing protein [Lacipirellula limnantheis]|uniref:PA14 domain-containing protein n=1 Tax=Lacipirellula limnantheis TaxID=2528024 RepID=UPI00119E044B|nr:PA14 domain-containing protein [Lacipirellula limnantheis]